MNHDRSTSSSHDSHSDRTWLGLRPPSPGPGAWALVATVLVASIADAFNGRPISEALATALLLLVEAAVERPQVLLVVCLILVVTWTVVAVVKVWLRDWEKARQHGRDMEKFAARQRAVQAHLAERPPPVSDIVQRVPNRVRAEKSRDRPEVEAAHKSDPRFGSEQVFEALDHETAATSADAPEEDADGAPVR